MEVKGSITAAKLVKGVAEIVVDTFEEGVSKIEQTRNLCFPLSESMTERDVFEYIGKGRVKITIFGEMIYNIWPE
jgi:hypothetical protein